MRHFQQTIASYLVILFLKILFERLQNTKSLVQGIFGLKMHQDFPRIVKWCDDECGEGIYPKEMYGYKGIQYVAPVNLPVIT